MLFWIYEKEKFHQNSKETNNYRFGVKILIWVKRENIKTTIEEIVAYWSEHEDESGLSVDLVKHMNVAGDVVIKES